MAKLSALSAKLPTLYGDFEIAVFPQAGKDHIALIKGKVKGKGVLCRVHSECITSEVFGSLRCDCREQLEEALEKISKEGRGVLIYLRQEGRGIGLAKKIKAYRLQDTGMDTIEANQALGEAVDSRDFSVAALMLSCLGVKSVRLLTNNPKKIASLEKNGVKVETVLPIAIKPGKHNARYLKTKKDKMGHGYI